MCFLFLWVDLSLSLQEDQPLFNTSGPQPTSHLRLHHVIWTPSGNEASVWCSLFLPGSLTQG